MATLSDRVLRAHRCSVPLAAITTADPRFTARSLARDLTERVTAGPLVAVEWDLVEGLGGLNDAGQDWVERWLGEASRLRSTQFDDGPAPDPTIGKPVDFLIAARQLPARSIAFFHNAHRFLEGSDRAVAVVQALSNLRDRFKTNFRTLVLLGPDIRLPAELKDDVVIFEEPLPGKEELGKIVDASHLVSAGDGGGTIRIPLDDKQRAWIIDSVAGLSAFGAEQVLAMAMTKEGCNLDIVRELRRRTIEQTPGLSIYKGGEAYGDIGGIAYAKEFFGKVLASRNAPRAIVYVDEIEKAIAGASGHLADSSGVSQDILGTLLSFMEDRRCNGTICFGPPGCSKSLIAKATGNQGKIDTIQLDVGGLKGSYVGESERNIRQALKVIDAASAGRSYWIATCNSLTALPAPLLRRFTHGVMFFDLPDAEERQVIWKVHERAFGLEDWQVRARPDDKSWSGADIRNCCELAHEFEITVLEASRHIGPVAVSSPELIEGLRQQAHARYKSASTGELYRSPVKKREPATRPLDLEPVRPQ